jgi:hypothetical protein
MVTSRRRLCFCSERKTQLHAALFPAGGALPKVACTATKGPAMYSDLHHDSYQRLHDAAKRQAEALRRQAIDDFWHQLGQALRRPARLQLPREA